MKICELFHVIILPYITYIQSLIVMLAFIILIVDTVQNIDICDNSFLYPTPPNSVTFPCMN